MCTIKSDGSCTGSILAFLTPPVTHGATSKAAIPPPPWVHCPNKYDTAACSEMALAYAHLAFV